MSNWALELQQFDIGRIWIRGEANVLADAPSRAPWEEPLAQFLPIPDMPVRHLVRRMYQDPDDLEDLVSRRRQVLVGDAEWQPILDDTQKSDFATPDFGARTPEFGKKTAGLGTVSARACKEVTESFGAGEVLWDVGKNVWDVRGECWPRWPMCVLTKLVGERVLVGDELARPLPAFPLADHPIAIERVKDDRGYSFVIRFPDKLMFEGGTEH